VGEAEDELCRLQRDVELRAVADALKLDPVGVRQVAAQALGRRRPSQRATPSIWWASSSTGMCSCSTVRWRVARRRPSGVDTIAPACGAEALACSCSRAWTRRTCASVSSLRVAQPPAGASATTLRARPRAASCSATKPPRVAREVRGRHPRRVHRALDGVGDRVVAVDRRAARVAGQRGGEHVVAALQRRQHELPRPPGVEEAVQQDERRPAAAAVRWRERREQGLQLTP
jgi:hypothetical protein